jgi:hypothetical protein
MPTLNSGLIGIKSRKENVHDYPGTSERLGAIDHTRKSVQLVMSTSGSGAKRQRVATPAAFKVIDEEDEPRSSPTRKASQAAST